MRKVGEVTHVIPTNISVGISPVTHKRIRVVILSEKREEVISVGSIDPVFPKQESVMIRIFVQISTMLAGVCCANIKN